MPIGSSSPIAILLANEQPNARDIAKKYKKGLQAIIENGVYQKIVKKYYTTQLIPDSWFEDLQMYNQLYTIQEDE
jgi:ABC-type amino acid transport substrate-binding protein